MPFAMRNLQGWLAHLESLHPKTIELGLERVAEVARKLNLHPDFPIIIVGGTNGKGSVCAMLESILHAAGYRVGCYTSPHLLEYNERVRIGKAPVEDAELCTAFEEIEQARDEISLTYFEFGTLAAMQCLKAQKVEVAILEVGLGGRLDAVNVFDADCAVVTTIDLDHMDYLGDTRDKIAFEKAGIFRKDKAAILGDIDMPEVMAHEAARIGANLMQLGREFVFERDILHWHYRGKTNRLSLPYPALRGAFQLHNASTALAVLDAVSERLPVDMSAVRRGLMEVTLPGRFQVLPGRPTVILDVAHNPHAARSLAANLTSMSGFEKTYAVCAMLKDKDIAGVVQAMKPHVDEWYLAGIAAPRGASGKELKALLGNILPVDEIMDFASISDALQHACNVAGENDRIIVFGSFYTVAAAMSTVSLSHTSRQG